LNLYVSKEVRESLTKKLKLPDCDSQDWEYVVSNPKRISEFLSYYKEDGIRIEEKFALMNIIISSLNDAIEIGQFSNNVWNLISYYLTKDMDIHKKTILYWALDDDTFVDGFAVTPLMKELVLKLKL
jgi:hypothetical protein